MADYDLLGSFSTGGAKDLNADLIGKLKEADKGAALSTIDNRLEKITGLDAETGEELEELGEIDTFTNIKILALDMMSKISSFNLGGTSATTFDQVAASTTGSAAIFDALDVAGLEEGTTNIEITQLAQRDVYQSVAITEAEKDAVVPVVSAADVDTVKDSKLTITVGGEAFDFDVVIDKTPATIGELQFKTIEELAAEINENEKFIASVEEVATGEYRLIIKSAESGLDNALEITQNNINLGFGDTQKSSAKVDDTTALIEGGQTATSEIVVNGVSFSTNGKTYDQLATEINDYDGNIDLDGDPLTNPSDTFNASVVDGQIVITADDFSDVTITQTDVDMGFYDSTGQSLVAQNLKADVDGIDYNISSNKMTIQGNLTMSAVELGKSTISIEKDNTTILQSVESFVYSYNAFSDLVSEELGSADSPISDRSSIRSILTAVKDKLFESYGENKELNLFNFGLNIDLSGRLSVDSTKFAESLKDNYDDVKNLFLGNTTDADLAESDPTKYIGLGTMVTSYLDNLDSGNGALTRYEEYMLAQKESLEKEREKALETLDIKYETMSKQFSDYGAIITQMESSFSGLKMMIAEATKSS